MSTRIYRKKNELLRSAGPAILAMLATVAPGAAQAEPTTYTGASVTVTNSVVTIDAEQNNGVYQASPTAVTLGANSLGSITSSITGGNNAAYALQGSTVTVGASLATGNTSSATGYANTATLGLALTGANTLTGTGTASVNASADSTNASPTGAKVTATDNIGVHSSQQASGVAATVANSTDIGITVDYGSDASTMTLAGNKQTATGVLNSATSSFTGSSVNASTASVGLASSQSSYLSSISSTVDGLDSVTVGTPTDPKNALNNSTLSLVNNSQTATAVANSGSNAQSLTGTNTLELAGSTTSGQQANTNATSANAVAGFATVARQELVGGANSNAASAVTSTIDNSSDPSFQVGITGDVTASTLSNNGNTASALAHGNELANSTNLTGNAFYTGTAAAQTSGTVAGIAARQSVDGFVNITADVKTATGNQPSVYNTITGSVDTSSTVTASDNTVSASAAGNLVSNGLTASATTINTKGADAGAATATTTTTLSDAAFAVANQQTVSTGTTVLAKLANVTTGLTTDGGTSVTTAITKDVSASTVSSTDNLLSASATGNGMLASGNTLALGGTNLSTTAAISSSQAMDGSVTALIGSAGTAANPGSPGSSGTSNNFTFSGTASGTPGNYTFTGTTSGTLTDYQELQTANPSLASSLSYSSGIITLSVSGGAIPYTTTVPLSYISGATAPVPATPGTPATGGVIITVGGNITDSQVAASGNTTEGTASGNRAVNALTASPTDSLALGDAATIASADYVGGTVSSLADLAVANQQSVGSNAKVTSQVGALFTVQATGATSDVSGSHVAASDNTQSSAATGNTAVNSATLSGTSIATTAAVTSSQSVNIATITADTTSYSGALAYVGDDILNSTVAANGNTVSGSAAANRATNSLFATASNALSGDNKAAGPASYDSSTGTTNASADMALANIQNATAATVTSTVGALFEVRAAGTGSDVTGSTVTASNNGQSASAIGNAAGNTLALGGSAITVNSALANRQSLDGIVNVDTAWASSGAGVTVGQDITDSTVAANGNSIAGSVIGNVVTNALSATAAGKLDNGSAVTAAEASLSATKLNAGSDNDLASSQNVATGAQLTSTVGGLFWVDASSTASDVLRSTVTASGNALSTAVTGNSANNSNVLSAATASATAALANNQVNDGTLLANTVNSGAGRPSGATVVIGLDVTDSTVSVDNNSLTGSTTGNTATNRLAVAGSQTVEAGDTTSGAVADPSTATSTASAKADNALLNVQSLGSAANFDTTITGQFDIVTEGDGAPGDVADTSDVKGSTLSASGNAQLALTSGNVANNSVALSGGSITTNAALQSNQTSAATGDMSAVSTMTVNAPAANTNSTLTMNRNSNTASSTLNDATNTMSVVSATSLSATTSGGTNALLNGNVGGDYVAAADYAVNNYQAVTAGSVTATATTTVANNDQASPTAFQTNGITSSTVAANGNATNALATSNRSNNSLSLSALGETASGGVLNQQTNAAGVTAGATSTVQVAVAGYNDPTNSDVAPISTSGVTINNNATTARAGGNSATNALNVSALSISNGAEDPGVSLTANTTTGATNRNDSVSTTFAVLNEQGNSGAIVATATVTYGASFYAQGTPAQNVDRSAVTVNGNSALAVAYGNAATNTASLSPLNGTGGTTLAVASNQANTGNITATVAAGSSVALNASGTGGNTGPVYQSSLAVNGNALGAAAYGNSVTSTVTFGGNNISVVPAVTP